MVLSDFGGSGTDSFGQSQSAQALGTGFVVDKQGYILTNAHVVDESGQRASSVTVVFNKGGSETQRVPGQLVGVDVGSDVAVIKVDPSKVELNPLPLGDSDSVQVGEPVVAIGNPLGYDFSHHVRASSRPPAAACRRRTARPSPTASRPTRPSTRATRAARSSTARARSSASTSRSPRPAAATTGLGFAVPINTAIRSLEQLKANGKVTYAWMGVGLQTLTSDVASTFGMKTQGGALVESVSPGSPAAKAGIKGGDRQVTVQGQQFTVGGDVIVEGRQHDRSSRPTTSSPSSAPRSPATRSRSRSSATARPRTSRSRSRSARATSDRGTPGARRHASGRAPESRVGRLPLFRVGGPLFLTCGPARVYTLSPGREPSGAPGSHHADARRRGRLPTLDERMQALLPIVRGLAEMFGPDCEVVLHDVRRLPHSIVAIENGGVTGRTVGDVPTDRMLRSLRNLDETQDVRLYLTSQRRQDPQVAGGDPARRGRRALSACSASTSTSPRSCRRNARSPTSPPSAAWTAERRPRPERSSPATSATSSPA